MRPLWPQPLALLLATAAAIDCPGGTSLVNLFDLNGTRWAACEDLQVPGGALALVSSSGTTEWFHKTHETYGSAPLGSDDASYYLNLTKKAAVEDKTDVLAVRLLATEEGLTWSRVASVVPPIRHAGVRTFVGSRGSVADTSFTDTGEDAAGYGFPPPMSFVFNLTNLAEGGKEIGDPAQYVNSSRMAEGLVGDFLPIVIFYFPLVTGSPYLPNGTAAKGGGRYWTMIASPEPDMRGSREQRVWFRFAQLECTGAALEPPCALVGRPQHWDTYWWSNSPGGGATNTTGPPAPAAAGGFYGSLLANRRWWAAELAAEGMMHLALPSPASTNGTWLATQMVHNLVRGMITWHDTWGPRYGVLPGCEWLTFEHRAR